MGITNYIRRQFRNGVSVTDTIPAGCSAAATTLVLADGTTFPDGSIGPFICTLDQGLSTEEKILCASRSGATVTVAVGGRGYNGTAASAHTAGCSILHTIDAQDMDEANQTMFQTLGAIAAKGDLLVGSAANTLTKLAIGSTAQTLQVVSGTLSYVGFGSGRSQTIGSSNTDGTDTTYARSDHVHSGVTTVNGSAGAITAVTTFNGGSGVLAQTNGYGISGANANPPVPAVALSSAAGHLSGDYTVTASLATFLTTASLAAGTWVVSLGVTGQTITGSTDVEIEALVGTATATFDGQLSTQLNPTSTAVLSGGLVFIATVTVTGTLVFQAKSAGATNNLIKATTPTGSLANATGYTAVRVA